MGGSSQVIMTGTKDSLYSTKGVFQTKSFLEMHFELRLKSLSAFAAPVLVVLRAVL